MGLIASVLSGLRVDVPLDVPVQPDAAEAQRLIIQELSKPEYRAAQPTWFDRASKAFWDWLTSLRIGDGVGVQGPILVGAAIVVAVAIVSAFLIFGMPRLNRRSAVGGALFGDEDARDAAAMRRSAGSAAAESNWTLAIEEIFRSIARGLAERTLVTVTPGTTARGFAARAGAVLPAFSARLLTAASAFDDVRYLDREGSKHAFDEIAELERDIRAARLPVASLASAQVASAR